MTALQEFENLVYPDNLNRVFVHLAESLRISRYSLEGHLNYISLFDDEFQTVFPSDFEFKRWPELEEELSVGIKLRVNSPSELNLYIGSILKSLAPVARFFFKQNENDALPALFEMVNSPYYAAVEIPPVICEIIKNDPQPGVLFQSDEEKENAGEQALKQVKDSILGARNDFPFKAASQAYSNLVHIGAYIESVLLECGQKKRLKEYQEDVGVSISDSSLLEQVALVRHWSVEYIEELMKKRGKGGMRAIGLNADGHTPIDPLHVSKWDSLSFFIVKEYMANQYLLYGGKVPNMEWEKLEGENYDQFDEDISSLVGKQDKIRQACLVIIQKLLYGFLDSNKKRHEYKDDKLNFFIRDYLMLMKYVARVIGKTLSLEPAACFFRLSEELGFSFDSFFNAFVDYQSSYNLGFDPRLLLRLRADQCMKCNKQDCIYRIDNPANFDFGPKGELRRISKPIFPIYKESSKEQDVGNKTVHIAKGPAKSKVAKTSECLHTGKANALYSKLENNNYIRAGKDGKYIWLKDLELFAYFCYKLTDTFVGKKTQIEVKYITQAIISCNGNMETVSSYANRFRKGKKRRPTLANFIDNTIEEAYKGYYGG